MTKTIFSRSKYTIDVKMGTNGLAAQLCERRGTDSIIKESETEIRSHEVYDAAIDLFKSRIDLMIAQEEYRRKSQEEISALFDNL